MPLVSKVHWTVYLENITLNGVNINIFSKKVLFDTGSTFSFIPEKDFNSLIALI